MFGQNPSDVNKLQICSEATFQPETVMVYYYVVHMGLRAVPPSTSLAVYSEYSGALTLGPCGLDQSAVIMLICALSHWKKEKKRVKSFSLCVYVCV